MDELEEIGITATELSRQLRVPQNRISQIIAGKRAVPEDARKRWRSRKTAGKALRRPQRAL